MVTDIITLKLAYTYLSKFESNQGKVTEINLQIRSNHTDVTKSIEFPDLNSLKSEINKYGNISLENLECYDLHLYELKKFYQIIDINGVPSTKNLIQFNGTKYHSKSFNVNKANLELINGDYSEILSNIKEVWGDVKLSEYIKEQKKYVDCGYIKVFFADTIKTLETLYKKYKNV